MSPHSDPVQSDAKVGDWVMLAVREGTVTYHKAKVTAVSGGKVTVRHNDLKGTLEEVPVASPRLWHGTLEDKAWEVSELVFWAIATVEPCSPFEILSHYSRVPLKR